MKIHTINLLIDGNQVDYFVNETRVLYRSGVSTDATPQELLLDYMSGRMLRYAGNLADQVIDADCVADIKSKSVAKLTSNIGGQVVVTIHDCLALRNIMTRFFN